MSKIFNRLVFGLWIVAAPLTMIGCSEGEKPATPAATTTTETPAPADATPAPATTSPAEPAPAK